MATKLSDFHRNTSVPFYGVITQEGANPDITSDTVRLIVKSKKSDTDADAVINVTADVTTNGASGRFDKTLSPTETDIAPGSYHAEFVWTGTGFEYVMNPHVVTVLERVEDTP